MQRKLLVGAGVALVICSALFLWLRHDDTTRSSRTSREGTSALTSEIGEGEQVESDAAVVEEETPTVAEIDPDIPPLLAGDVLGEGVGVPGAQVMLFSARRVESLIERLEDRVTALAGGGMPDIPGILSTVRGELEEFRRSAIIAVTDDVGHFEVREAPEGGYFLLTYASRWLFRYGDVVSLSPERTSEITLELERGASIAGRVVRPGGEGIGGVRVIAEFAPPSTTGVGPLLRKILKYVNGEFLKGPFEVRTDSSGEFEIASLPSGTYNITAYDDRGVESTVQGVITGTTGVLVLYGEGATIVGTLVTPQGFPLPEIPMKLERIDSVINIPFPGAKDMVAVVERVLGAGPREAESGPDGRFSIAPVGAGLYRLTVEASGLKPHQQEIRVEWGDVLDVGEVLIDLGSRIAGVVRDARGRPMVGAVVQALRQGSNMVNGAEIFRDMMSGRLQVETDEDGAFELYGLSATQEYRVTASSAGYAPETVRGVTPDGDALQFLLEPGQTVRGRVIRADTQEGIADAVVRSGPASTRSGPDGSFVLDGVISSRFANAAFGAGPFGARASVDTGAQGEEAKINCRAAGFLREQVTVSLDAPDAEIIVALETLDRIAGVVLGPTGDPQPGALVRLTIPIPEDTGPFPIDTTLIFFAVAVTDLEGQFVIERYLAGRDAEYQLVADYPGTTRGVSEQFSVGEITQVSPFEIRLKAASTVTGTVTDGVGPVPGAVVRLIKPRDDGNAQEMMMMQLLGLPKGGEVVHTDSEGRFSFDSHAPGEFEIGAEMVGFSDSPTERFTLLEGATVEFNLQLDPGRSIAGVVTDDQGTPLENAVVRVLEDGAGSDSDMLEAQRILGGAFRSTRTDESGAYELTGLPSASYMVIAEKRGFAKASEEMVWSGTPAIQNLALLPSSALRGQVVDLANGRPITEFQVSVVPEEGDFFRTQGLETVSDPQGFFERPELEPGRYDVEIRAAGFGTANLEIELLPGILQDEVFSLEQAGRLRGVVVHAATGDPVSGAVVALARPNDDEDKTDEQVMQEFIRNAMLGDTVTSDAEGAFLIDTIPSGPQTIVVNHDDFVQLRQRTPAVGRGEEIEIRLVVSPGRSVEGQVVTPSGASGGSRFLLLRGNDEGNRGVRKNTVSDEAGKFTFSGLSPGSYRIFSPGGPGGSIEATEIELNASLEQVTVTVPEIEE